MQRHWLCVGSVTAAAKKAIAAAGGECLDLPMLYEEMPPLVLISLPDKGGLIFYDNGFHYVIGTSSNEIIGALYSKSITQTFARESVDDFVLCSEEEWEIVWKMKAVGRV